MSKLKHRDKYLTNIVSTTLKVFFSPLYLLIILYRNFIFFWSDKKLAEYIKESSIMAREENAIFCSKYIIRRLKRDLIFVISQGDVRAIMKIITVCKNKNKKIKGFWFTFLDILVFLYKKRNYYNKLGLIKK